MTRPPTTQPPQMPVAPPPAARPEAARPEASTSDVARPEDAAAADVDPRRCPICGRANACGIAEGASTCWCFETSIPSEVRARVPVEARDLACVCRACADSASARPDATAPTGDDLTPDLTPPR